MNVLFVIPIPTLAQYFRVREFGGATLDIQELYFDTTLYDTVITRISRSEYISLPNKNQGGRPSSFWVDRQINPVVYLWPTPIPPYNNLYYTRIELIQDIGAMTNMADIPQRFYEALIAALAVKLSVKYMPDRIEFLRKDAEHAFDKAAQEDSERVPLRIYGDFLQGWTRS